MKYPAFTRSVIANIESGRERDLCLSHAIAIADALDVSLLALAVDELAPWEKQTSGISEASALEQVVAEEARTARLFSSAGRLFVRSVRSARAEMAHIEALQSRWGSPELTKEDSVEGQELRASVLSMLESYWWAAQAADDLRRVDLLPPASAPVMQEFKQCQSGASEILQLWSGYAGRGGADQPDGVRAALSSHDPEG